MNRSFAIVIGLGGLCGVLLGMSFEWFVEVTFQIAFGWIFFLIRVLPELRVNWVDTLIAAVCLTGLAIGLNRFLRWLHLHLRETGDIPPWQLRWTSAIVSLVMLAFMAGICVVGVVHQTVWLLTSPGPFTETGGGDRGSSNNLKQIGLSVHDYNTSRRRRLPASTFDARGNGLVSWQVWLLPYLEHGELFRKIDRNVPWNDPRNAAAFSTPVTTYLHPVSEKWKDEAGYALSHYAANVRAIGGDQPRHLGTTSIILAGEVWANYRPWGYPANWRDPVRGIHTTPDSFGSPGRPDVAQFVMMDGSVLTLTKDVDPTVLEALSGRRR